MPGISFVIARSRDDALPLIILTVCCLLACVRITDRPIIKDASETLTMALNLAHHGVMSLDEQPPLHPSMARDPLPVWTTAAAIRIEDLLSGAGSPKSYFQGPRAQGLKLQNVLWLAVLMTSAALAARRLAAPAAGRRLRWIYQLAGGLLAALPFTVWIPHGAEYAIGMDSLDTELLGAMWLLLGSLLLMIAWTERRLSWLLLASTVFGLMALTKAAVFYVYPSVLVLVAAVHICSRAGRTWPQRSERIAAAALVPFLLLCGSWMTRNLQQTGLLAIGERGGPVLLYRGFLDTMSGEEFRGSFYAWSGWPLNRAVGKLTGFTPRDLQASGRLHRLQMGFPGGAGEEDRQAEYQGRPDMALGWYHESRAIYENYLNALSAEGFRYPSGVADRMTRDDGIALVKQHPLMHLALVLPLLWRGALFSFPVILIALSYALRTRRGDLVIFGLPAFALILFYAMTSHFVERYGWLPRPCALVLLVAILPALIRTGWHRPDRNSALQLQHRDADSSRPGSPQPAPHAVRRSPVS